MSWFNTGLNTIKGQLTNLAQEVLAEVNEADRREEGDELNPGEALENYKRQNEELIQQCSIKDTEIASLRKQISNFEKNAILEGSWICESDNFPSDSSGKNDTERNSESSSGGEMITIPLDYNAAAAASAATITATTTTIETTDSWEKIHKNIDEKDQKLKKLLQKNLNYKEIINQLTIENQELTGNLETLDNQHNVAVQELLDIKNDLQNKLTNVNFEYELLKKQHQQLKIDAEKNLEDLKIKLETRYENEFDSLNSEIQLQKEQNFNLKRACEAKDEHVLELTDEINNYNMQMKEKELIRNDEWINLKNEIEILTEKLRKFEEDNNKSKNETTEYLLESITKQDNDDDFIVLHNDSEVVTAEVQNNSSQKTECIKIAEDRFDEKSGQEQEEEEKSIDCSNNCKTVISSLQNEIKNLENEIQSITDNYEKLKNEKDNQQKELDFALQKIVNLENQIKISCDNQKLNEETIKNLQDSIIVLTNSKQELEKNLEQSELELKKKIHDLDRFQTQLNEQISSDNDVLAGQNDEKTDKHQTNVLEMNLKQIQKYLLEYLQIDILNINENDNYSFIETAFKTVSDKINRIKILENELKNKIDEITKLKIEMKQIEHEKETLRADITHYEEECEELMKNNEILLNELKNIKQNKLETISENDEESIAMLEKQLDDCNTLNRTLEEEYNDMHKKLKEFEFENKNCTEKIKNLQEINENLEKTSGVLKQKNEELEEENCRLVFEINEMKTDDKKSAFESQMFEYKTINQNLEEKLENLKKDHSNLQTEFEQYKSELFERKKEYESIVADMNRQLEEKNKCLTDTKDECKNLNNQIESLKIQLSQLSVQQNSIKDEQYHELNNRIQHLTEENTNLKVNYDKIKEEIKTLNIKHEEMQKILELKKNEAENKIAKMCQELECLTNEKNNLIEAMTIKHNENVQYYNEIQRLDQLLKFEIEKNSSIINRNCENCQKLQTELSNIKSSFKIETEKLNDQINFLMEKSNILTTNLLTEQTNQKLISQENAELIEKNSNLIKDLERLRQHLVEQEESHTQEIVEMQNTIEETKNQMIELQMQVKNSSNAYTSASIRANQQAETLQTQYNLILQQRDELSSKLSEAEDRESKNQAAIFNLQCALEQFQTEKEKDILSATNRIRKELQNEHDINRQLQSKISSLNQQLTEANQGLLAATRLSNQLEACQLTIASLKEQVSKLENLNQCLEEKLQKNEVNQENNIEKGLVKSLIIGYIVSNNQNDKNQILKMISSILDFNEIEMKKINLNQTHSGWLSGILYDKPSSEKKTNSDGLVKAFVEFLEKESQPRSNTFTTPNLLNISLTKNDGSTITGTGTDRKSEVTTSTTQKTQSSNIQPILLNETTFEQFHPSRNSSSILKDILNST